MLPLPPAYYRGRADSFVPSLPGNVDLARTMLLHDSLMYVKAIQTLLFIYS